ncbi:MAG TPA: cation:proton antiporter [Candidatus Acidoferrales bacterium]|nr:cation:proton antiporter [Candidatus Acidoferrales bacterium]
MIPQVLIALAVILAVAHLFGALFRRIGQPPVVGEMIAGISLGPSLLGRVAPALSAHLFPATIVAFLSVISQLGVILFMFLVGVEFDIDWLRRQSRSSFVISQASIATPLLLGAALAVWLYRPFGPPAFSLAEFALFIGVAMSITAFPVLARILRDLRLNRTRLGMTALTAAALGDITAWCLLAFVIGVVQSEPERIFRTVALAAAFIALMFLGVRRLCAWIVRKHARKQLPPAVPALLACVGLALASLATSRIGVHALFGAFLLGVVIPHDSVLARNLSTILGSPVRALLLPVFFASTGLFTEMGLLRGPRAWTVCLAILAVASLGKIGGSYLAARLTGSPPRPAAALAVLMNTRGLMELIVLNVGLKLGILSPALFAMFVIMAVVTTFATAPILQIVARRAPLDSEATP